MSVDTTADKAAFVSLSDFGESATVGGVAVNGIFDKAYIDSFNIEGNHPVLICASTDIPLAAAGDTVVVNSTNYTLQNIQDDGVAFVTLILEEQ